MCIASWSTAWPPTWPPGATGGRGPGRRRAPTVTEVSIPELAYGLPAYYLLAPAEASSNLSRYDGVRYGLRVDGDDVEAMIRATRAAGFGAEVKRRIMLGTYALSAGYYDAYYGQAQKVRTLIIRRLRRRLPALSTSSSGPTTPSTAFPFGDKADDPLSMYLSDLFTVPSNLAGHPAISVPFGTDATACPSACRCLPRRSVSARVPGRRGLEAAAPAADRPAVTAATMSAATTGGWELVIGLEVHCELRTETKLFCGCRNAFGDEPNTNVCPVCLGLPGSLPVLNRGGGVRDADRHRPQLQIPPSIFHRKNYFYPDMPKDYQISQFDEPINVNGWLELPDGSGSASSGPTWKRTRARPPTSAAVVASTTPTTPSSTTTGPASPSSRSSPEPDIRSADQARPTRRAPGRSWSPRAPPTAGWRRARMRVDANVSVRQPGDELGTRCEMKNLNSFRSLVRAIDYETGRQVELLDAGGSVVQQTRHWDEDDRMNARRCAPRRRPSTTATSPSPISSGSIPTRVGRPTWPPPWGTCRPTAVRPRCSPRPEATSRPQPTRSPPWSNTLSIHS